ncbi:fasciclin domain-containing protein [Flavobacteriaceae bacterium M23B6Z8]
MKHFLKIAKIFTIAMTFVAAASCSNDDDGGPRPSSELSITENAVVNGNLNILVEALTRTNLAATLDTGGPFTVFAPNDQAFTNLLNALGASSLDDVSNDQLTDILLNHVINGETTADDLRGLGAGYVTTLSTASPDDNNLSLYFNTTSGVVLNGGAANGGATVLNADIDAENGVIHIVDAVITVPNVVNQAIANPDFSTLVAALTRASFGTRYTDLLSNTNSLPFTVFAPTNQAFANLLTFLDATSLDDIDDATLQTVLDYHVIPGDNIREADLVDGATETTFEGSSIEFDLDGGAKIIDGSDMAADIVATNVQTENGVIHAINKVLLPESVFDAVNPTIAGFVAMNANYSSLLAALQRAELAGVLDGDDINYTVFAPDNDAFAAFLEANNFANLEAVPVPLLTQVLLNHVIGSELFAGDLSTSYANTLATNADSDNLSIYVNTENGVALNGGSTNGGASVVDGGADIDVRNGVIHAVDAVIGLPTVVTFAVADATFSSLVAALTRDDQPDFVSVLSGETDAPFTVFAPTNTAFTNLINGNAEWNSLADVPGGLLTSVLQHHVIPNGNIRAEDITDGLVSPATLEGDTLEFAVDGTNVTITDGAGNAGIAIEAVNVQASNGVIHAIGAVLIPDTN